MLIQRMLPCKCWPLRMWEFNPEGPWTIQHFFGLKLEGMCKLFFGPQVKCPDTTEDAGLSCNRLDAQVSNLKAGHFIYIYHNHYSENSAVARNGLTRQRGSGIRRHFLKARPSKGRKHRERALPRRASSPHHAYEGASPPTSHKLFINSKVWYYSEIHNQDFVFCSPASSSSQ